MIEVPPYVRDRVAALQPVDAALWAEVADYVATQRLRDKRGLLTGLAEGLALLPAHPDLRDTVHESLRRFTGRSARLTMAYMSMWRALADRVSGDEFREIDRRAHELARDVDLAASFMDYAPAVLSRRDMGFLCTWHDGAIELAAGEWWASRGFLEAAGRAAHWLRQEDLPVLVELGSKVAARSRHAVKGLFNALPALVAGMRVAQLVEWVDLGLRVTRREDDLVLYMSYGSKRSQEAVEVLCRETSFAAFRPRVTMLLEAFLGRPAQLRSMFDLLNPASVPPDVPAFSDGTTLYMRPALGCVGAAPFALYKLVALHAAGHERFGTFEDLGLQEALRPNDRVLGGALGLLDDVDRFLIGVAEDTRIDAALFRTLPGLRRDARRVLEETYGPLRRAAGASGPAADSGRAVKPGGVALTAASLRAHLAAAPFGVHLLADRELEGAIDRAVAPLAREGALPVEAVMAAGALRRMLETRLPGGAVALMESDAVEDRKAAEVPYPPYHDHLFLGLELADMQSRTAEGSAAGSILPGTPVDVPGSLHPSEIITGLEISARDTRQEADLLILDDDEAGEHGDVDGEIFTYDEWDTGISDYRTRWCTVRCRTLPLGDPGFVAETVGQYKGEVLLIRRQFERLRPDRIKRFFRQVDGDELDMDALVEAVVDRMAGVPMSDNVFIRRDKKQRDVACLFLLDMSDSTDQLVEGDRRVIDVEKEGLVLLSEALGQLDDQYAIMGFSSRGRKGVDLFVVKDFSDEFDADVAARIGGIAPRDYTRLGAAIRHAVHHVGAQPAAARLLVLLSDGRPYDMGYGDMRYAMEDTKMALSEARRAGVSPFCITVDPKGPDYLEDLFGLNGYTVIQNVGHLPTKLPRIYHNLTV